MVASRTGNVDAIKVLLDHGADVNAKETLRGTTALMWAAWTKVMPQPYWGFWFSTARVKAQSDPAERGKGPALGKSENDPRKAVAGWCAGRGSGCRHSTTPQLGGVVGTTGLIHQLCRPISVAVRKVGARLRLAVRPEQRDYTDDAAAVFGFGRGRPALKDGGGLTPLVYAVRSNDLDSVKVLLAAGSADVNQVTGYGCWSPLLVANPKIDTTSWRGLSDGSRRGCESGQQRRVDAALPGHRQNRNISKVAIIRCGRATWITLDFIKLVIGQRRERKRPDERQH